MTAAPGEYDVLFHLRPECPCAASALKCATCRYIEKALMIARSGRPAAQRNAVEAAPAAFDVAGSGIGSVSSNPGEKQRRRNRRCQLEATLASNDAWQDEKNRFHSVPGCPILMLSEFWCKWFTINHLSRRVDKCIECAELQTGIRADVPIE